MPNPLLAAVLLIGGGLVSAPVLADDCTRVVVTAKDGYTNVRSAPRVASDNLVAALPSGIAVQLIDDRAAEETGASRWTQVRSPAPGWIHNSQITTLGCDAPSGVDPNAAIDAIERLARQARGGNQASTASFLALSRGVDGSLAEVYAEALGAWATQSPATLVAAVAKQPFAIRRTVRDMVAFALEGASLAARGRIRAEIVRQGVDW